MPFDADLTPQAVQTLSPTQLLAERLMGALADPDPKWAAADPARLVAYLFVSPRPCPALDALLAQPA